MRRWNGWGDDTIDFPLPASAQPFLEQRLGKPTPLPDASFKDVMAVVPPSRLPDHPLVIKAPRDRILHARGQSLPDWLALRSGKLGAFPDGVAYPVSAEQVRALITFVKDQDGILIPYGGGTSVVGHINPPATDRPILTVNLSRMNRLLDLDDESHIATFGAGASGPDIESQLRAHGYTLGHYPQSFEFSTLGGWIVTRSSGQQSLGYGKIERLFAGGTMETPSGPLEIQDFPASAAGPDLREIVMGSEGRLGILTRVKMRVSSLPPRESFRVFFLPHWDSGCEALRRIVQAGIPLSMLRLSNETETETQLALAGHRKAVRLLEKWLAFRGAGVQKCMVTVGITGTKRLHRTALKEASHIFHEEKAVHAGKVLGHKWKKNRFRAPYLRNLLWERGYCVDTLETAINWDRVSPLMAGVESTLTGTLVGEREKVLVFSHLSHLYSQGSSIYTTFLFRAADTYEGTLARWRRLKKAASETIMEHGGTITHHHGVGTDHAPYLLSEKGPLGINTIKALCRTFDPDGLMNPGKLVS
jgi:alkyldihydroxyacetonephosphate synthase